MKNLIRLKESRTVRASWWRLRMIVAVGHRSQRCGRCRAMPRPQGRQGLAFVQESKFKHPKLSTAC